jgi:hypothetical protein
VDSAAAGRSCREGDYLYTRTMDWSEFSTSRPGWFDHGRGSHYNHFPSAITTLCGSAVKAVALSIPVAQSKFIRNHRRIPTSSRR